MLYRKGHGRIFTRRHDGIRPLPVVERYPRDLDLDLSNHDRSSRRFLLLLLLRNRTPTPAGSSDSKRRRRSRRNRRRRRRRARSPHGLGMDLRLLLPTLLDAFIPTRTNNLFRPGLFLLRVLLPSSSGGGVRRCSFHNRRPTHTPPRTPDDGRPRLIRHRPPQWREVRQRGRRLRLYLRLLRGLVRSLLVLMRILLLRMVLLVLVRMMWLLLHLQQVQILLPQLPVRRRAPAPLPAIHHPRRRDGRPPRATHAPKRIAVVAPASRLRPAAGGAKRVVVPAWRM
ncbi:hypothetical protein B0H16DRAFT_1019459 [Mycena metata]|uniref:Uncharacterized protein n=1 Tax=Mycena metata TaxID=1033252 RepID=A0AAD7N1Y8_9AGAR|nr:hypothetical protein B0H16DRAFT_1019459 [Mycena metata]